MSDDPAQENILNPKASNRSEYLKFVGLLAILLVTVVGLAVFSPLFFDNVVPSIMGLDGALGTGGVPPARTTSSPGEAGEAPNQIDPSSMNETGQEIHVVQEGETLDAIAARYSVSIEAIAAANHLVSRQLHQGTELVIPAPAE